jgi:hypothetical protein
MQMKQEQFEFMKNMKKDYEALGEQIGILLNEKQESYGNAFGNMETILQTLYPNGIKTYQYKDILTLTRILDKVFRIANLPENRKDKMGEEPYKDIAGYAILALAEEE